MIKLLIAVLLTIVFVNVNAQVAKPKLLYKTPIEGMDQELGQFIEPLQDGNLVVGADDVIKLSDDNKILWHYTVAEKGTYDIDCYLRLADGTFLFGGWNKVAKAKNLWLFKLDGAGKKVWEKDIPVKDGEILALMESLKGPGFLALITETKEKRVFSATLRTFDETGKETMSDRIVTAGDVVYDVMFSQDVSLIPVKGKGLYIFGVTLESKFEAYRYPLPGGEDDFLPTQFTLIEKSVVDKEFSGFLAVSNPKGGFYAAYTAKGKDGRNEDYRLIALDDELKILWTKDLGGSLGDGVSSMIPDGQGNLILAGYSYSGISGEKSEPAFEKGHCDVWVIKVNGMGEKLWDKTITGPGCILETRLFIKQGKVGVIFREETHTMAAMIEEE